MGDQLTFIEGNLTDGSSVGEVVNLLGMKWIKSSDDIAYAEVSIGNRNFKARRSVLCVSAKIFDHGVIHHQFLYELKCV